MLIDVLNRQDIVIDPFEMKRNSDGIRKGTLRLGKKLHYWLSR
jgi:hypothetical protein